MNQALSKGDQLAQMIREMGAMDENTVIELIKKHAPTAQTRQETIVIQQPSNVQHIIDEHMHPVFKKVLKLVATNKMNVLLIGPAGCGKSWITEQVARALKRMYGVIHGTAGASESHLQGWLLPIEAGGTFSYVPAEFVELWEKGNSVFTFDELDAFDPNMLIVVNGALASGTLHIPQRFKQPHVKKGENVAVIATANTFGTGADILYAGRNQLDAATLDRFYPIVMDYDKELEKTLADGLVLDWAWRMREKVQTLKLRRVVSTRTIIKASMATKLGFDWAEVKRDLLTGWTRDELAKVGELQS